jgi:predicted O-methyltransferase YrrM
MNFDAIYNLVGSQPCTEESQCRVLYDWIRESRPAECMELGFFHGKTSCIMAAALQENGSGHLTSIDVESVLAHKDHPSIQDNLERAGLSPFVTPA